MSLRLNGWQRLGIVLSIAWAILVAGFVGACLNGFQPSPMGPFSRLLAWKWGTIHEDGWQELEPHFNAIATAWAVFAPIVAGWVGASAIVYAVRWVRKGFEHRDAIK